MASLPNDDILWEALRRESGSVAQHLGIGAEALGNAHYEQTALYAQMFFALSVGMERAAKLVLTLDAAVGRGNFLSGKELRQYGHDLASLLAAVDEVAMRHAIDGVELPATRIHAAIVETLTNFASNVGRYYNLEVLGGDAHGPADPIAAWYENVTRPVADEHYSAKRRERDEARARASDDWAGVLVSVIATSETGEDIRDVRTMLIRNGEAAAVRPWERMYVLQLVRYVTHVLSELAAIAQARGLHVPYLHEYFDMFQCTDRDFRELKSWVLER